MTTPRQQAALNELARRQKESESNGSAERMIAAKEELDKRRSDIGYLETFNRGMNEGVGSTLGGVQQLIGQDSPELAERMRLNEDLYQEAKKVNPLTAMGSNLVGNIAGMFPADLALSSFMGPAGGQAATAALAAKKAGMAVEKLTPYLTKVMQGAKQGAKTGAAHGGLGGFAQYVPEGGNRYFNTLISTLLGGVGGGLIGGGIESARESNWLPYLASKMRGKLSNEELAKNAGTALGTETNLGRVIGSPILSRIYEDLLKNTPFSGAKAASDRTSKVMENRAEDTFTNLYNQSGKFKHGANIADENVGEIVQKNLQKSAKELRNISSQNYKTISDLGKEFGIVVTPKNLPEVAQQILTELDRTPLTKLNADPKLRATLKKYVESLKNAPGAEDVESLGHVEAKLGQESWKRLNAGDRYESGKLNELGTATRKDIDEAIMDSGVPELIDLGKEAKSFYRQNIAPLNKGTMKKYINDPDLTQSENIIANFIKFGAKGDKVKTMQLLTKHLSPETMDKLRYHIFSPVDEQPLTHSLVTKFNKLGPKQQAELIPDQNIRGQLKDLSRLAKLNPDTFNEMFNPKTGAKVVPLEILKQVYHKIAPALGIAGGAAAGTVGGIPAALSVAGTFAAAKGATKLLTSEKVRNKIVKAMIKGEQPRTELKGATKAISDILTRGAVPAEARDNAKKRKPLDITVTKYAGKK